jgi:hypothetical protein
MENFMKILFATLFIAAMGSAQMAQAASGCDLIDASAPVAKFFYTTYPTTATTYISMDCRLEALNVKEDALKYRMTGEASELLRGVVQRQHQLAPELSENQIIEKFINVHLK